ncbi:hypothetical protein JHN55_07165 [Streptomyces sp. MBT56]|uniref:hypothetical protein n=1 Tax=unclassified Streptomyces TaxID=2593676 RepID=UPI00190C51D3|nr:MULTISPECIES: hypothetical protein [unclassified Streptomyces]MBK3556318.1 hypothetical protein [Streptomyces sp. MBT56]MBK3601216.1 hypothetical protein [Streptomyces sp. MBT54]MBK3614548.1 hypothetical protein [Streptomyces sp. MBT98]
MSSDHGWRARTSQRVMADTRSGQVGRLVEKGADGVVLEPLTPGPEWSVPSRYARAATPEEVAAALADE